jgi:hypothetical protein
MLIDHKWVQAAVVVVALSAAQVSAAETQEENNHLSQMKAESKPTAPQMMPDMLGPDVKSMAKQDSKSLAEMDDMKLEFKPAIGDLKPKL